MQMKKVIGMSSSKFMGCSVVVGFGSKGYGGGGGGCRDRAPGALPRGCGGLAGPRRPAPEALFGPRRLAAQVALRVLPPHLHQTVHLPPVFPPPPAHPRTHPRVTEH